MRWQGEMTSGFTSSFQHYLVPDADQIKTAMTSGMIVLDANVLLGAYRFAPAPRNELLEALEKIGDRIWIPHRVAEEFHRNRLKVISDYDEAYNSLLTVLQTFQGNLESDVLSKISELANRVALPDKERDKLRETVRSATKESIAMVDGLRGEHGLGDPQRGDPIYKRFQIIFNPRTGPALSEDEYTEAIAEAKRRIADKIPPGYADAKKDDPHGDYLVWKQTLLEAKRRRISDLVFVTSDTKEDWYLRIKGKTVCARPELARELMAVASARLVMMSTNTFLRHAGKHLNVDVSPETLRESSALSAVNQDTNFDSRRPPYDMQKLLRLRDDAQDGYAAAAARVRHARRALAASRGLGEEEENLRLILHTAEAAAARHAAELEALDTKLQLLGEASEDNFFSADSLEMSRLRAEIFRCRRRSCNSANF
jgi:hypothetical protein